MPGRVLSGLRLLIAVRKYDAAEPMLLACTTWFAYCITFTPWDAQRLPFYTALQRHQYFVPMMIALYWLLVGGKVISLGSGNWGLRRATLFISFVLWGFTGVILLLAPRASVLGGFFVIFGLTAAMAFWRLTVRTYAREIHAR